MEGKFTEARKVAEKALILANKTDGSQIQNNFEAIENLANIYYIQGEHEMAELFYNDLLRILIE